MLILLCVRLVPCCFGFYIFLSCEWRYFVFIHVTYLSLFPFSYYFPSCCLSFCVIFVVFSSCSLFSVVSEVPMVVTVCVVDGGSVAVRWRIHDGGIHLIGSCHFYSDFP